MKSNYILILMMWLAVQSAWSQSQLVILHTNDTHSRIEPIPETDRYNPGQGGIVNRKFIIDSLRNINKELILLDAGDFVQGTPYYNIFKGRVEVEAINRLGYDAVTLGNHEFDYGLDTLQMALKDLNCPIVVCNYDFSGTPLEGMTRPYIILKRGNIKIGIVGAGIQPEGLIQKDKYEGMKFLPVNETVNHYAEYLKKKEKCDIVIALTHIGYYQDIELAQNSRNIDMIIGGHTHTYLEEPDRQKNLDGKEVFIHQAGGRGSHLGEIIVSLTKQK